MNSPQGYWTHRLKQVSRKSPVVYRALIRVQKQVTGKMRRAAFEASMLIHHCFGIKNDKLNIGSGRRQWAGWTCLDEIVYRGGTKIDFDQCGPFPVESNTIRLAYSSHFLEHISDKVVSNVLGEIWRCLTPGGLLVLKIPDFDLFVESYIEGENARFENIGVDSVLDTWPSHGLVDSIDTRFSMMFCGYMNSEYGSHFTDVQKSPNPRAFHGPPRIERSELHDLVLNSGKSPHKISQKMRKIAIEEGEVFRWNHQNAWSKKELEALLIEHFFEVQHHYNPEPRELRRSIPDIDNLSDWSMFIYAEKPHTPGS